MTIDSRASAKRDTDARYGASVFSFFSGLGLLDLGLEAAGFDVVMATEIVPWFTRGMDHARNSMGLAPHKYETHAGSISDLLEGACSLALEAHILTERNEGKLVGFVGGPPCPDFSKAGNNKGREGDNGKLTETYVDIILKHRPDFFLFENVQGLISTKAHNDYFEYIMEKLRNNGYSVRPELLNSINYGVPQDRKRIILVGALTALKGDPFPIDFSATMTHPGVSVSDSYWPSRLPFAEDSVTECPPHLVRELSVEHWFQKNDTDNHPNAMDRFKVKAGLARMQSVDEGHAAGLSYKRLHRWRYSPTACYGNNEVHLHPYRARRLSVAETLAIQSLPKEFTLPPAMPLSYKFKGVGNGVPYLMAKGVGTALLKALVDAETRGAISRQKPDEKRQAA